MKYYRLSKDGEELNIILACENEEFERKAFEKYGKEYTLTECEAPKDAQLVNEEPCIGNPMMFKRGYHELERMAGGFANVKTVIWDGPNCGRCANRFNGKSDWCFKHHKQTENCYRFKLEK